MLFRNSTTKALLIALIPIMVADLNAQSRPYEGPTDEAGDPSASRLGLMNGNRVSLQISNKVSFGGWPSPLVSLWPNDATGLNTFDSFNLIVGNMVFIKKCPTCPFDSIPITDEADIQSLGSQGLLDTLWCAQSSSIQPNFMDQPLGSSIEWGFYPVFGYFNRLSDYAAISNRPDSWPSGGWPSRGLEKKWPGEWNGRFGRGVKYADLEAYWAANDAQDQENLLPKDPTAPPLKIQFYPRPGHYIGDLSPNDVTIQRGDAWGGLGLRAEVRAYQWNNQQTRDAVFFEYNVSNISDYDLARGVFGFYLDCANGNKSPTSASEDQIGFFDTLQAFTYTWSLSGAGFGGGTPPVSGWAFLESPGVANDGIDNDHDGMIDERRDNPAEGPWGGFSGPIKGKAAVIAAFVASHDTSKFLKYFGYKSLDQVPAVAQGLWWPGDEDGDWRDGKDANGNGRYDPGEDAGDDVGLDGVGPSDLNYTGPDADGTECNHRPDFLEGVGAEPDFAITDVHESDMLGLTSFSMFPHPQTTGAAQLKNDQNVYDTLTAPRLLQEFPNPSNLYVSFGSGVFRLAHGRTERLSMSNVNSYEPLIGLNDVADHHPAPSLYQKLRMVELVYQSDYRFAQAPLTPTLTAKAADGKVYLSWDDRSDKLTREPFLGGANDFEGYKLYRSTDKHFQDAEVLRDGYGNPAGKLPIFQCDVVDSIKGFVSFTSVNGLEYYLGNDTGLRHYFVDNTVQNGRTYYYALVAYDYGIQGVGALGLSMSPSESNTIISLDESENVIGVGQNVQIVTPHQNAAGYTPPNLTITDPQDIQSNATITASVFNSDIVKPDHVYSMKFDTAVVAWKTVPAVRPKREGFFTTKGYSVSDITAGNALLYAETPTSRLQANWEKATISTTPYTRLASSGVTTSVIDGLQYFIQPKAAFPTPDTALSKWQTGNAPIGIQVDSLVMPYYAYDYNIVFVDTTVDPPYRSKTTSKNLAAILDANGRQIAQANKILLGKSFPFHIINKNVRDAAGFRGFEELDAIVEDANGNGVYDPDIDTVLVGYPSRIANQGVFPATLFGMRLQSEQPKPGDVYRLKIVSALNDSITFTVHTQSTANASQLSGDMKRIKVVPNPYLVTNTMEQYISNQGLNQRRVLLFTHIPAGCSIKIFTSSGVFVRQIDVNNPPDNGTVQWDMLTKEGLEIAAGIYVYDVKSNVTGEEKLGKFAVIK